MLSNVSLWEKKIFGEISEIRSSNTAARRGVSGCPRLAQSVRTAPTPPRPKLNARTEN